MASSDSRRIGVALTAGGVALLILGVLLLFDRALLALGNVRLALSSFCGTLERSSEPRVSVFSSYAIFFVDALPRGRCSVRWPKGRNAFLRQASKRPRALLSLSAYCPEISFSPPTYPSGSCLRILRAPCASSSASLLCSSATQSSACLLKATASSLSSGVLSPACILAFFSRLLSATSTSCAATSCQPLSLFCKTCLALVQS